MSAAAPESPFPGLVPFSVSDANYFFGRDTETALVVSTLTSRRLTLLFGPSGVGKSSILRAGVVHRLREKARERVQRLSHRDGASLPFLAGAEVVAAPVRSTSGARDGGAAVLAFDEERLSPSLPAIPVLLFDWRDDPIQVLAARVQEGVEAVYGHDAPPAPPATADLRTFLAAWTSRLRADIYLILDQFDEFFVWHGREGRGGFADQLAAVVCDPATRTNVLLSFREDNLAQLDQFRGAIPNLFGSYIRLDYMNQAAARCAILGPIQRYNRSVAAESRVAITADTSEGECLGGETVADLVVAPRPQARGLVEEVLEQVRTTRALGEGGHTVDLPGAAPTTPGERRVETPYLQLVMARLWDEETRRWMGSGRRGRRTMDSAALLALGGAEKIVSEHLAEVLRPRAEAERHAAAGLFQYLVTPAGRKIALTVPELASSTAVPQEKIAALVKYLEERSLLRNAGPPPGEPENDQTRRWEITHDVLGKAALQWRTSYLGAISEREAIRRSQRRARNQMAVVLATVGLVLGAAWLKHHSDETAREIQHDAQAVGLSNTLTAFANENLMRDAGLAAALAATADSIHASNEALDVLRRAIFEPEMVRAVRIGRDPVVSLRRADGARYLAGTLSGRLVLLDSAGRRVQESVTAGPLEDAAPLDGGTLALVASGPRDRHLRVVSLSAPRSETVLGGHVERVSRLAVGTNGLSVSAGRDGRVVLHQAGKPHRVIGRQREGAVAVAVSPDGGLVASGANGGRVRIWDVSSGVETGRDLHRNYVYAVAFDPAGSRLASASRDTSVLISVVARNPGNRPTLRPSQVLRGHRDWVRGVEFSPDGRWVVTASKDGTARVWDAGTGRVLAVLRHPSGVSTARFAASDRIITSGDDGVVRYWRWSEHPIRAVVAPARSRAGDVLASSNGTDLWMPGGTMMPRVRRAGVSRDVELRATIGGDSAFWNAAAVSPDGRLVSLASDDGLVRLWNAETGEQRDSFRLPETPAAVAFIDRRVLAAAGEDGAFTLWDIPARSSLVSGHAEDTPSHIVKDLGWVLVPYLGQLQIFDCDVCLDREELRRRYSARIRPLTEDERRRYLGQGGGTP